MTEPSVPEKVIEEKAAEEKTEVKFTRLEKDYLLSKRLGRLATVNKSGRPHVVPIIFSLGNHDRVVISGAGFEKSLKFKDILENPNVAFVVDSVRLLPWTPMGLELRGTAHVITMGNAQKGIEIIATKKVSWGLTEETVYPPPEPAPEETTGVNQYPT